MMLPWRDLMSFGIGTLRLPSRDFWSMTVPELTAAVAAHFPSLGAPSRSDFENLFTRFPDSERD